MNRPNIRISVTKIRTVTTFSGERVTRGELRAYRNGVLFFPPSMEVLNVSKSRYDFELKA